MRAQNVSFRSLLLYNQKWHLVSSESEPDHRYSSPNRISDVREQSTRRQQSTRREATERGFERRVRFCGRSATTPVGAQSAMTSSL
jgi:hypothetical protein